jgi:hypothetical protein
MSRLAIRLGALVVGLAIKPNDIYGSYGMPNPDEYLYQCKEHQYVQVQSRIPLHPRPRCEECGKRMKCVYDPAKG